jgi:putative PIN family toxin of toxin-antitoxin system
MRVVLDTNVLISALISPAGPADLLYQAWRSNRFTLITSDEQLEEFRRVTRYLKLRPFIDASAAGTILNELRLVAVKLTKLPPVDKSSDPADNFLLGMAVAGKADYLVTGDKQDLLKLSRYKQTHIVPIRKLLHILNPD